MLQIKKTIIASILCVCFSSVIAENNQKTEVPLTPKNGNLIIGTCKPNKAPCRPNFPLSIYFDPTESTIELITEEPNSVTFSIFDENENIIMSAAFQLYPDSPYIVLLDSTLNGHFSLEIIVNGTVFIGEIVI